LDHLNELGVLCKDGCCGSAVELLFFNRANTWLLGMGRDGGIVGGCVLRGSIWRCQPDGSAALGGSIRLPYLAAVGEVEVREDLRGSLRLFLGNFRHLVGYKRVL